jgi:hypothetical protein
LDEEDEKEQSEEDEDEEDDEPDYAASRKASTARRKSNNAAKAASQKERGGSPPVKKARVVKSTSKPTKAPLRSRKGKGKAGAQDVDAKALAQEASIADDNGLFSELKMAFSPLCRLTILYFA